MTGRRLIVLLCLIALFVAGVFVVNKALRQNGKLGEGGAGDPGTIRGLVDKLLPSGKVIVVKKESGEEVLVSLTSASTITDEIGEPLFYSDIAVGMPISAAGIRGEENDVLIPSLITVQLARTYGGLMVASASSLRYEYFSLRYNPKLWDIGDTPRELEYKPANGCRLSAGAADEEAPPSWKVEKIERRIGGNIFYDSRYSDSGKPVRRTLVLDNPGYKYGLSSSNFGSYIFHVYYKAGLSQAQLINCMRAVDDILETFRLRNASENILMIEPDIPIHVGRGETLIIEGMARSFDSLVQGVVIDDGEKVLWRGSAYTSAKDQRSFGKFSLQAGPLNPTARTVQLRLFHYSPNDGSPADTISLPMTIE